MSKILQGVLFAGTLFLGVQSANAGVIYSEGVTGDLSGDGDQPGETLLLSVGQNSITGSASLSSSSFDPDSFTFVVPTNTFLESITFSFVMTFLDATVLRADFELWQGGSTVAPDDEVQFTGTSPLSLFSGGLPLGPGTYALLNSGGSKSGEGEGGDWDYQFDLVVREAGPKSVPEPHALPLLFLGLMSAAALRSRRGRKSLSKAGGQD